MGDTDKERNHDFLFVLHPNSYSSILQFINLLTPLKYLTYKWHLQEKCKATFFNILSCLQTYQAFCPFSKRTVKIFFRFFLQQISKLGHIVRLTMCLDFWIPAKNRQKSVIASLPKWVLGFPNEVPDFPNGVPGFQKWVPCFPNRFLTSILLKRGYSWSWVLHSENRVPHWGNQVCLFIKMEVVKKLGTQFGKPVTLFGNWVPFSGNQVPHSRVWGPNLGNWVPTDHDRFFRFPPILGWNS